MQQVILQNGHLTVLFDSLASVVYKFLCSISHCAAHQFKELYQTECVVAEATNSTMLAFYAALSHDNTEMRPGLHGRLHGLAS